MKEDEMGGACAMYGERKKNEHTVLLGKPEGKSPIGRPKHKWRIILKCILKNMMGWHRLDSPGFHKIKGIYFPVEELLASQEGLCVM
jgi:hypothetical protein